MCWEIGSRSRIDDSGSTVDGRASFLNHDAWLVTNMSDGKMGRTKRQEE